MTAKNEENILELVAGEKASETEMPLGVILTIPIPSAAEEGDATVDLGVVPFAGVVASASYTSLAAYAESATLYQTHTLEDLGPKGEATTAVATLSTKEGGAKKEKLVAGTPKALALSGTAANLVVAAGDVLKYKKIHTGKSAADTGGVLTVTIHRVVETPAANTGEGQSTGFVGSE
jgi:hypothetical protein